MKDLLPLLTFDALNGPAKQIATIPRVGEDPVSSLFFPTPFMT